VPSAREAPFFGGGRFHACHSHRLVAASAAPADQLRSQAKVALDTAASVIDLRGWPVVADGGEVGIALNVIVGVDGDIEGVRARLSMPMGLGTRVVDIPAENLSLTRDAIVLHVSVAELVEPSTR
jgi:hypothetical protein